MKRTIRISAVFMAIAILSVILVSCAKTPMGKYTRNIDGMETVYEFKLFSRVTRTTRIHGVMSDGATVVKEGKYQITQDEENPDRLLITLEFDGEGSETSSFYQGEINNKKFIKIGTLEYVK